MECCKSILLFLMLASSGCSQQEELCSKTVISSCGDCIRSGPHCVWCQQLNFTKAGEQEAVRCDTRTRLMARGCEKEEIISPMNDMRIVEHQPLAPLFEGHEPVQMSPQKISLKLRPGLPATFSVSFKRAEGYPVDLYYLMDLSYSMKDDLAQVKGLGRDLFNALKKITEHARIGFGAFVDKTVLPYTNTNQEKLQKPCDENDQQCQAAFGYRHVLSMTDSEQEFRAKVSEQFISGNLDSPEGSLDAMMQAAVCGVRCLPGQILYKPPSYYSKSRADPGNSSCVSGCLLLPNKLGGIHIQRLGNSDQKENKLENTLFVPIQTESKQDLTHPVRYIVHRANNDVQFH